ncbi:LysR family transcriptional regulator [Achromobacter sp. ACM03]|uniref:LysR substrate-binding domain-containing protein n=1 Tax=Achromobacter sp. ACM03 TaxID=2769300 RepID=UPI001782FCAA|nr:LysR family transcriptional regulator [Achromobacter sp. ACM03]MBD9430343.1 LysR family transcriptional regulator [Achromobacter sp. ACM03]
MDRIDLFRVYARVVECANFSRAADTLGLPRSTVSAAVQELEGRLGARLLNRTTRQVAPTQEGAAFYERCLRLVADMEEAENLFRHSSVGPSGMLRVDVPGRVGRLIVAPALPSFLAAYPQIDVTLGVTDRAVNLIEEGVDCVLRVGVLPDSGLVARPIGMLGLINVASPAYLARHGVPLTPDDLEAGHACVNYASPSTGRLALWEWLDGGVSRTAPLRGRVTVNSAEAYIASCVAGLGLIQIPAYDVQPQIAAGELVEVMPDHRPAPMPMTLLYPQRRSPSRRVQVFADWLEALLRPACGLGGTQKKAGPSC